MKFQIQQRHKQRKAWFNPFTLFTAQSYILTFQHFPYKAILVSPNIIAGAIFDISKELNKTINIKSTTQKLFSTLNWLVISIYFIIIKLNWLVFFVYWIIKYLLMKISLRQSPWRKSYGI